MSTITSSIQQYWQSWNETLENSSAVTFKIAARVLPASIQENETEAKLLIHSLINAIWLQVTAGNHFITPYIAYPLAVAGSLAGIQPLLKNNYNHFGKFRAFSNLQKIASVAFLVLCISTQLGVIYMSGVCTKNQRNSCFSLNLWFAFGGIASSVIFNSIIHRFNKKTPLEDEVETIKRPQKQDVASMDPVAQYVTMKATALKDQIIKLREKIRTLNEFIKARPDLEQLCQLHLREDLANGFIAIASKCEITDFDPNNRIHQMGKLGLEKNYLEHEWNEQIRFIKRHKNIYKLLEKYLNEDSSESGKLLSL